MTSFDLLIGLFIFVLGTLAGSFINAALYRVKKKMKLGGKARSRCPHCSHQLSALDLVPIFSYIFLQGRCRYCGKPIGLEYPLIELLTAAVFLVTYFVRSPQGALTWAALILLLIIFSFFIFITFYDLRHRLILTRIIYPLGSISLVYVLVSYFMVRDIWILFASVIAAVSGFALFYLLYAVSRGKWMGGGDVRLAFVIGLLTGKYAFLSFFLAFISGSVAGILLLAAGHFGKKKHLIPFGPFMVFGCFITLLFGEQIIEAYYRFSYPLLLIIY